MIPVKIKTIKIYLFEILIVELDDSFLNIQRITCKKFYINSLKFILKRHSQILDISWMKNMKLKMFI